MKKQLAIILASLAPAAGALACGYVGPFEIDFVTPEKGIAVYYNKAQISDDGGKTWESIKFRNRKHEYISFKDVEFINENTAFILGSINYSQNAVLFRTDDGGRTWSETRTGMNDEAVGIDFINREEGMILMADGRIAATVDGGITFQEKRIHGELGIMQMFALSENKTAFTISYEYKNDKFIQFLRTSLDGGRTWKNISIPEGSPVTRIVASEDGQAILHAGNQLLTVDAVSASVVNAVTLPENYSNITFDGTGKIILVQNTSVLTSSDGGITFRVVTAAENDPELGFYTSFDFIGDGFVMIDFYEQVRHFEKSI